MSTPTAADEELAAGRIVAGRYRVAALLGRGGMGRVYQAEDEQLGRAVALKLLAVASDGSLPPEEASRRLMREARAAAAFSHPNVVAVYDVGEHEGRPFIAMELVRGRTLRDAVGDATVAVSERLRWLTDLARALAAAHRAGLVHRDVKPDNAIVADDGTVKLLDFGIARRHVGPVDAAAATARDGTITVEGTLVGTPAYMAPEQLRAEKVDGRADQFAWGVMTYELLLGQRPWPSKNAAELIAAVLSKPAPPLVVDGVPPAVAAVVARALSKSAGDRFASMEALLAALQAQPAEQSRRPLLVAAALAGVVAMVVVGLVVRSAGDHRAAPPTKTLPTEPTPQQATPAPLRFPCSNEQAKVLLPCNRDEIPWCDRHGGMVACCPGGLAPVGHDGICACPKGGTSRGTDCPQSLHTTADYTRLYLSTVTRRATGRCGAASERLGYWIRIDPDGRVFDASITSGASADVDLQRCVVDNLRALELDPPPNGAAAAGYGPSE